MKEKITSERKCILLESQKEMLKLLKSKTGENIRTEAEEELAIETRSFHTPIKIYLLSPLKVSPLKFTFWSMINFCYSENLKRQTYFFLFPWNQFIIH